jgi:hypothetical protein
MTNDVLRLRPGDDVRMMKTPDAWPLGPVLCLKDESRPSGEDTGLLILHPDIKRTEVFVLNLHDDRLRQLLDGDPSGINSIIYSSFEQIKDDGWEVD